MVPYRDLYRLGVDVDHRLDGLHPDVGHLDHLGADRRDLPDVDLPGRLVHLDLQGADLLGRPDVVRLDLLGVDLPDRQGVGHLDLLDVDRLDGCYCLQGESRMDGN